MELLLFLLATANQSQRPQAKKADSDTVSDTDSESGSVTDSVTVSDSETESEA